MRDPRSSSGSLWVGISRFAYLVARSCGFLQRAAAASTPKLKIVVDMEPRPLVPLSLRHVGFGAARAEKN